MCIFYHDVLLNSRFWHLLKKMNKSIIRYIHTEIRFDLKRKFIQVFFLIYSPKHRFTNCVNLLFPSHATKTQFHYNVLCKHTIFKTPPRFNIIHCVNILFLSHATKTVVYEMEIKLWWVHKQHIEYPQISKRYRIYYHRSLLTSFGNMYLNSKESVFLWMKEQFWKEEWL